MLTTKLWHGCYWTIKLVYSVEHSVDIFVSYCTVPISVVCVHSVKQNVLVVGII